MRWFGYLLLPVVLVVAGCAGLASEPPSASPESLAPPLEEEVPAAEGIVRVRVPSLAQDGFERKADRLTVRVRNLSCVGVGTGSGFAIDDRTLMTNRHVVAGASELEVNTWDGRTLRVSAAEVGVLGDVAFMEVDGELPVVGDLDGSAPTGSEIAAVGYPLGGAFTIAEGVVIDRIPGDAFEVPGEIVRINADVQPGNSGGPLLDNQGRVVAVVYAIEIATGFGLAIPIDTVDELLARAGTTAVPPCGYE